MARTKQTLRRNSFPSFSMPRFCSKRNITDELDRRKIENESKKKKPAPNRKIKKLKDIRNRKRKRMGIIKYKK